MLFAVTLTLCTFSSCNDYFVSTDDSWTTKEACMSTLTVEADLFQLNPRQYLKDIGDPENVKNIQDWDMTCQPIADADIP